MKDNSSIEDGVIVSCTMKGGMGDTFLVNGRYSIECLDSDGKLKWEEPFDNLVTTVGKNYLLDQTLAGSAYTAAWYFGLISGTSATLVAGDTMASHAGWTEYTNYSNATRIAISWSAASSGTKATTGTYTFNINGAGGSVYGAFVTSGSAISGTTGTLYSEGAFSTYRTVASGDSLIVSYSSTIT